MIILQNAMTFLTTQIAASPTVTYSNSLLLFLTLIILSSGTLLIYAISKKYVNIAFLFDMAKMTIRIVISNEERSKGSKQEIPNKPEAVHIEEAPKEENNK